MEEFERVKRRLRRAYMRQLVECEQTIRDCHWWARHRTEHPPIDCEWFVLQAAGLRKCLNALDHNEPIDPAWLQNA